MSLRETCQTFHPATAGSTSLQMLWYADVYSGLYSSVLLYFDSSPPSHMPALLYSLCPAQRAGCKGRGQVLSVSGFWSRGGCRMKVLGFIITIPC